MIVTLSHKTFSTIQYHTHSQNQTSTMKKNRLSVSTESKNNLRVSKKFYNDISTRIATVCESLPDGETLCNLAIRLIDNYIESGKVPARSTNKEALMIFTLLRSEIDKAISRSLAARTREARKKADTDCKTVTIPFAVGFDEQPSLDNEVENSAIQDVDADVVTTVLSLNRRQRRRQEQNRRRKSRQRIKPLCFSR